MKHILFFFAIFLTTVSFSNGQQGISLNELLDSAIKNNSRLSPIDIQRRSELTRKTQLSMQAAPMFEILTEMIPLKFDSRPMYQVMVTQEIVFSNKLGESGKLAETGAREKEIMKQMLSIELIREVKLNYFGLYLVEKMLEYNNQFQEIISSVIKSQEINYAVGKGVQNHILKSNNESQMLDLERIELETNRKIFINNLSLLSNSTLEDNFSTMNVDLLFENIPHKIDTTSLIALMIENNPSLDLITNKILENRIEKNITGFERVPDVMFKGGYSYDSEMKRNFMMFGVGITLPFVPWNSKRIDAKIEQAELNERYYSETLNSNVQYLTTEMKNVIEMINGTFQKLDYINVVLLPQTDLTFNSSLIAYVSATDDFLNLLDSFKSLRNVNLLMLEEQANYLKQLSELESIIGKQIFQLN